MNGYNTEKSPKENKRRNENANLMIQKIHYKELTKLSNFSLRKIRQYGRRKQKQN